MTGLYTIVLSTLLSLALISFLKKEIGFRFALFTNAIAAAGGIYLFVTHWNSPVQHFSIPWFSVGSVYWDFEIVVDSLSIMMLGLISVIGLLVYWFSISYLHGEGGLKRYFLLLVLFMLSMYGVVLSANLFQLFFFWELVGFCSYGLIGFYYKKPFAAKAGGKAFMINRVADIFLIAGLGLIYQQFGTLSIGAINDEISFWAALLLFIGACGKSAQYPFAIWLPDAMAGPTPVSAFIHAATMVTAGVVLLARAYFFIPADVLMIMAFLGAVTATLGAIAAMVQHDIKKVLAYSTISQLGYMFIGLGSGAFDASLFHLFTHAFFKAGLFLNAGAVIMLMKKIRDRHQLDYNVQDIRFMGGLRIRLPLIFASFTLCALALIGVPLFSGYLSKDAIIAGAYGWAEAMGSPLYFLIPDLAFLSIILTAIYMIRLWSLVFLGSFRLDSVFPGYEFRENYISYAVRWSAIILGVLSLGFIVSLNPLDVGQNWVMPGIRNYIAFNPGFPIDPVSPVVNHMLIAGISVLMIFVGGIYAWRRYRPKGKYHTMYASYQFSGNYLKTVYNHYYLDKVYLWSVNSFKRVGIQTGKIDGKAIDRLIHGVVIFNVVAGHAIKMFDKYFVDGIVKLMALIAVFLGSRAKSLTSGQIQSHITAAIIIFVILLLIIML